jgi:exosome complex component RRP41
MKRSDGRKPEECRPMVAKAGVIKNADGSGYFKIGGTEAYAAVYGPRELHPRFMQDPKTGILRLNYAMMPFSGAGDRVRPGPNRRAKEINLVSEKAIAPVLDLSEYPNAVVDVFVELPQTDAGSRCAGICAASIALADAGIKMKDMIAAVSFGKAGSDLIVDLNYDEDSADPGTDVPIAMIPSTGEVTLMQLDGDLTQKELQQGLKLVAPAIEKITKIQRDAIRARFKGDKK